MATFATKKYPLWEKRKALDAWSTELMAILRGEGKTDRKATVLHMRAMRAG